MALEHYAMMIGIALKNLFFSTWVGQEFSTWTEI
jgi:hypothetical protein